MIFGFEKKNRNNANIIKENLWFIYESEMAEEKKRKEICMIGKKNIDKVLLLAFHKSILIISLLEFY